jgi:ribosome-associated protein
MINASHPTESGAAESVTLDPEAILAVAGELAADRKAQDIVALDLRGMVGYADYLLICSGRTDRQTRAIHDALHLGLKQRLGLLPRRVEGLSEGHWVLMDYLDVVVHVFTPDTRERYRLEQLWGEAPVVELDLEVEPDQA